MINFILRFFCRIDREREKIKRENKNNFFVFLSIGNYQIFFGVILKLFSLRISIDNFFCHNTSNKNIFGGVEGGIVIKKKNREIFGFKIVITKK